MKRIISLLLFAALVALAQAPPSPTAARPLVIVIRIDGETAPFSVTFPAAALAGCNYAALQDKDAANLPVKSCKELIAEEVEQWLKRAAAFKLQKDRAADADTAPVRGGKK